MAGGVRGRDGPRAAAVRVGAVEPRGVGRARRHVPAAVHAPGELGLEPAARHHARGALRLAGGRAVAHAARRDAPRPGHLGAHPGAGQPQRRGGAAGARLPVRVAAEAVPAAAALRGRLHAHRGPGQHAGEGAEGAHEGLLRAPPLVGRRRPPTAVAGPRGRRRGDGV